MANGTRTSYGSVPRPGSSFGAFHSGSIFSELKVVAALVSNAFTAPSSTPTVDTVLWQYDAAGQVAQWLYVVSVGAWKGVELS